MKTVQVMYKSPTSSVRVNGMYSKGSVFSPLLFLIVMEAVFWNRFTLHWVNKRCSFVKGKMKENDTFKCKICPMESLRLPKL